MHLVTAKSPYAATLYQVAGPVKHNIPTKFVERGGNFAASMAGTSPAMTRRGCSNARRYNRFRSPDSPTPRQKKPGGADTRQTMRSALTRQGRVQTGFGVRRRRSSKPDFCANWRARCAKNVKIAMSDANRTGFDRMGRIYNGYLSAPMSPLNSLYRVKASARRDVPMDRHMTTSTCLYVRLLFPGSRPSPERRRRTRGEASLDPSREPHPDPRPAPEHPALCSTRAGGAGSIDRDALRPDASRRPRRAGRVKSAKRRRSHAQLALASEHGEEQPFDAAWRRGARALTRACSPAACLAGGNRRCDC